MPDIPRSEQSSASYHRRISPVSENDPHSAAEDEEVDNIKHTGSDSDTDTDTNPEHTTSRYDFTVPHPSNGKSSYTPTEERQLLHKLDRRLTLPLCILYLLSFLDRSNIGNARVAGLQDSLSLTSTQFDLCLTAFYTTYIAFEWLILMYRVVPAHIYISTCVFAWGLVACLQATVTGFTQLLVLRAVLGVTEAAFGPGVPFYMTFFYKREELAYRVGLQISAAPLATGFAGAVAWFVVWVSGKVGGLEGWRALFLVEGAPSLVAAVWAWCVIPDGPGNAPWLSPRERKVAVLRLRGEKKGREEASGLTARELWHTLTDPKAYFPALMFLSVNVSFASLPVFLPTVIKDMSFSPLTSQILATPPYLFAFAFVLLVSRASDRIPNSRGAFVMACAGLSGISYAVIAITGSLSARGHVSNSLSVIVRYIAVYGAAMGLFSSVVLIITWQLNNQRSSSGKGMAMTILNLVGQCGPLVGVRLFPEQDAPEFVAGMAVCAGFMATVVVLAAALRYWLQRLNLRAAGTGKTGGGFEMVDLRGEEAEGLVRRDQRDGGGEELVFRYML